VEKTLEGLKKKFDFASCALIQQITVSDRRRQTKSKMRQRRPEGNPYACYQTTYA
jgi:hypothetical protein